MIPRYDCSIIDHFGQAASIFPPRCQIIPFPLQTQGNAGIHTFFYESLFEGQRGKFEGVRKIAIFKAELCTAMLFRSD